MSIPQLPFSMDCSVFLNWSEDQQQSDKEKAVVFLSLIATLKLRPVFDDSLEAKALKFLESVDPRDARSADAFLSSFGQTTDESLTDFVQSIGVLIYSANQAITNAVVKMLKRLIWGCSARVRYPLVQADLIPQLINILNPQSLSFTEAEDIHTNLMSIIPTSLWPALPDNLTQLDIEDNDEQQAVHEMVLQQVVVPSEKYICHLCVNRYSITNGDQSDNFLTLLAALLRISLYYQPTMDFVIHMPVILTITCCLTFFEDDRSIWTYLVLMIAFQRAWNKDGGETQQKGNIVHRKLRMEGTEDVNEEKLHNDSTRILGRWLIESLIDWNNMLGMNVPKPW
ncbi:hypothetical protein BLNAU_8405 [Blattamonas nauphoetae]|uniref:Uncharacterized protein n=1 Tax=Blattamonas nauphoetae TaxID=2049346 RepID=A0ABQ9XYJ5_9EUKA|nr:hypothetical protein BLNAU_8405 [Blattamonas nauphoetae]